MTDTELRTVLADRVAQVRSRIAAACDRVGRDPSTVTLVAVTKTVSPRVAGMLPELGMPDLGENRPQVLWRKAAALRQSPVRWHMIGHLQRNKIADTLPLVTLIHSIDSVRLLDAVSAEAEKQGVRPRVLLQVNASGETQKHGFAADEVRLLGPTLGRKAVEVVGLMGMAAYADDQELARPAFVELRRLRDGLRDEWGVTELTLPHLSMGMSGDYEVAIEEGATIVRIGTTIFHGLEAE